LTYPTTAWRQRDNNDPGGTLEEAYPDGAGGRSDGDDRRRLCRYAQPPQRSPHRVSVALDQPDDGGQPLRHDDQQHDTHDHQHHYPGHHHDPPEHHHDPPEHHHGSARPCGGVRGRARHRVGDSVMLDYQTALEEDIPGVDVEAAVSEQWGPGKRLSPSSRTRAGSGPR
jgi:hypothetical protein